MNHEKVRAVLLRRFHLHNRSDLFTANVTHLHTTYYFLFLKHFVNRNRSSLSASANYCCFILKHSYSVKLAAFLGSSQTRMRAG